MKISTKKRDEENITLAKELTKKKSMIQNSEKSCLKFRQMIKSEIQLFVYELLNTPKRFLDVLSWFQANNSPFRWDHKWLRSFFYSMLL